MRQEDAISEVLWSLGERDIAVCATGLISRQVHDVRDRDSNLYLIGSMGLVSAVAAGVAMQTERRVFVFDGDGSVLMDMGTLANVGELRLSNLSHLVFDNGAYVSTGGQPTVGSRTRLHRVASELGYRNAVSITTIEALQAWLKTLDTTDGPAFAQIEVSSDIGTFPPRVTPSPDQMTHRFERALSI